MRLTKRLLSLFGLVVLATMLAGCDDLVSPGDDSDSDSNASGPGG
jgi:hypothetical protein